MANAEKVHSNLDSIKFTKLTKMSQQNEYSITSVRFSPSQPKQGEKVTLFIELSTDFQSNRTVSSFVDVLLNNNKVKVKKQSGRLWITEPVSLHQIGAHDFNLSLLIEDSIVSERTRASILELSTAIEALELQIPREQDLAKKADMIASLNLKLTQKSDLEVILSNLKQVVSQKVSRVTVQKNIFSPTYPNITSSTPEVGSIAGGEVLTVSGNNLSGVNKVWVGSVELPSSAFTVGANSIELVAPALTKGIHDIVVEKTVSGSAVKATLNNAYYALEGNVTSPGEVYPVAFAGTPLNTQANLPVTLDGTKSYSSNGQTLTYQWEVISKPSGATVSDGVFSDDTVVSPSFTATTEGTYVVSLVVSNSTHDSVPSLTVVTVGPVDPVTVTPSEIYGLAQKDGIYIGLFRACNNNAQDLTYQILNSNRIVLLSGMNRGVIPRNTCTNFQFSVNLEGSATLSLDIPFLIKSPISFRKIIHLNVEADEASKVLVSTTYSSEQWSGDTDLEVLSLTGSVPLLGTFDEAASTPIKIKNTGPAAVSVPSGPVITHLDGSSSIITSDFPVGPKVLQPNEEFTFNLIVSPGTFDTKNESKALLEWETESGKPTKIVMLKTNKFSAPTSYSQTFDLGEVEVGEYLNSIELQPPAEFFPNGLTGLAQAVSGQITDSASGRFSVSGLSTAFPSLIGNSDFITPKFISLWPEFENDVAGTYTGKFTVKVKGYLTPFEYVVTGKFVVP
jgi:IPT/TIG domain.